MVRRSMGILRRVPLLRPRHTPGHSPGTLREIEGGRKTTISVVAYGPDSFVEESGVGLDRVRELHRAHPVLWVIVEGLGTLDRLRELGEYFELHSLALEDVLNLTQRPKIDDYDEHLFNVVRMAGTGKEKHTEQVSFFTGPGFVVTFHETDASGFDGVRNRIRQGRVRIRESGTDYLSYALLDAIVDTYFPLLGEIGNRLEELELAILEDFDQALLQEVHGIRRDLVGLRRFVRPMWTMVGNLIELESELLDDRTRVFLRDVHDHAGQAVELVESYREVSAGLMELYLSLSSQRMNEVTTVLTIIATIFIPLSFIAGVYGMNFDPSVSGWNMPELGWHFGYPWALGLMIVSAGGMLLYFWRKGWFR